MSEQDKLNVLVFQTELIQTRAKSFKIKSRPENITAFRSTVRAFIDAGMPLEQIANAGDFLEEEVERMEIDTSVRVGWQYKNSEVVEDENQIFAWQSRGETATAGHQLTSGSISGQELVIITKELATSAPQPDSINVVEGIAVTTEIRNSPFLQTLPSDLKKAP